MAALIYIAIICSVSGIISGVDVIFGYEDPSKNLVKNWDFEEDLSRNWSPVDANATYSNDSHTGQRSVKISNIGTSRFSGLTQAFTGLKPHTDYYLSAFIKPIKNTSNGLFFMIRMYASYTAPDGDLVRFNVARFPYIRSNGLWRQLGGDFTTGNDTIASLKFELEVSENDVEYLIDTVSLIELPFDPDWRTKALADIDMHRKNIISISMDIPPQVPFCNIQIKIEQTKRHFGIGATVKADHFKLVDGFGPIYRDFFFKLFEWAVFENDMKWKPMEGNGKGTINYARIDESMVFLENKNISVRGHSVFWSVMETNPQWVQDLQGAAAILDAMEWRLQKVVPYYKDKLIHWDADNENLHGKFYTNRLGDAYSLDYVHKRIRDLDPNVQIYLNDYQVMRLGDYTSAFADQVKDLQSRNVPVDGLGAQSHMREVPVSPAILKQRLKILTNSGVPVTITELGIHTTNVTLRAWQLDAFLHIIFSNPNTAGIVLWQFSDRPEIQFEPEETALFNGPNFTPNKAGVVFLNVTQSWRTNRDIKAQSRAIRDNFRAFHGAYKASVYYKDRLIKSQPFYLHPGQDIRVTIPFSVADFTAVDDGDKTPCTQRGIDFDNPSSRNTGTGYDRWGNTFRKVPIQMENPVFGSNKATKIV